MILVGSGSGLVEAARYCIEIGVNLDAVACNSRSPIIKKLSRMNVSVFNLLDLSTQIDQLDRLCSDGIYFTINFNSIVDDELLKSGRAFFNIHNGLVDNYRGLGEICVFAAVCKGHSNYGATLQKLVSARGVDSGPVVDTLEFKFEMSDAFYEVFRKSLNTCDELFRRNLQKVLSGNISLREIDLAENAYSYKDTEQLLKESVANKTFTTASNLGPFERFLPRLHSCVKTFSNRYKLD